jgi:hypothetical protein
MGMRELSAGAEVSVESCHPRTPARGVIAFDISGQRSTELKCGLLTRCAQAGDLSHVARDSCFFTEARMRKSISNIGEPHAGHCMNCQAVGKRCWITATVFAAQCRPQATCDAQKGYADAHFDTCRVGDGRCTSAGGGMQAHRQGRFRRATDLRKSWSLRPR